MPVILRHTVKLIEVLEQRVRLVTNIKQRLRYQSAHVRCEEHFAAEHGGEA